MKIMHSVLALAAVVLCWAGVSGFGPIADHERDAIRALVEGKRLTIRDDAPVEAKAIWEWWLKERPQRIENAKKWVASTKAELAVLKTAIVGKHAVADTMRACNFVESQQAALVRYNAGIDYERDGFIARDSEGNFSKAAFPSREIKEKQVARCEAELASRQAYLDGLVRGTYVAVPRLSDDINVLRAGMIGGLSQFKVASIVSESEIYGTDRPFESGARLRTYQVDNFNTEGLVDGVVIDAIIVRVVGTKDIRMVVDGSVVTKTVFEMEAVSFYQWLEPEAERADKAEGGPGARKAGSRGK